MIESIRIENFQCHVMREIEFDPQVTTLTGRTDSGKSAIIRAIRWLATNRPAGDEFIRRSRGVARVHLVADGHTTERIRGEGRNLYLLDDQEYRAFGSEVPEDITRLLNIDPELNFQGQLDSPFLFAKTAGEVALALNKVVNLGLIDATLAGIASEVRSAKANLEVSQMRLEQARQRKRDLTWTKQADADLKRAETLQKDLDAETERITELERLAASLRQAEKAARITVPDMTKADALAAELQRTEEEITELESLAARLRDAEETVWRSEQDLRDAEEEMASFAGQPCPVCNRPLSP